MARKAFEEIDPEKTGSIPVDSVPECVELFWEESGVVGDRDSEGRDEMLERLGLLDEAKSGLLDEAKSGGMSLTYEDLCHSSQEH